MGSPAMTTRGFQPADFTRVAEIVDRAVTIALKVDKAAKSDAESKGVKAPGSVKAFLHYLKEGEDVSEILVLRREVEEWVGTFAEPWNKDAPGH
jgi:glycine hydroxymethyltransferase